MKKILIIKEIANELNNLGWVIDESFNNDLTLLHLVISKDGQRHGWGMFTPIFCYTEAYEKITGKRWVDLINKTPAQHQLTIH